MVCVYLEAFLGPGPGEQPSHVTDIRLLEVRMIGFRDSQGRKTLVYMMYDE